MALPVSIGDAILCTQILSTLYKDYRGFPSSYNCLHNQLRTVEIQLRYLADYEFFTAGSHAELALAGPITQDRDTLLQGNIALCDNIRALLRKYDPAQLQRTSSRSKPVITRAKWAVSKHRSISALIEELRQNMMPLIEEQKLDFQLRATGPPARSPDFGGITFTDALDRHMYIPFEYCTTWEQFYGHLKLSFMSAPGERWVNDGRFEIYDEQNKLALSSEQWNTAIKPGMRISMTILLHVPSKEYEEGQRCPFCQSWDRRYSDNGRNLCFDCMKWFPVAPVQFVQIGVIQNTVRMWVVKNNFGASLNLPWTTSGDINDLHDIKALRRFNLIFNMNTRIGDRVCQTYNANNRLATRREMKKDLRPILEHWWYGKRLRPSSAVTPVS